jgi:hypothetical protein
VAHVEAERGEDHFLCVCVSSSSTDQNTRVVESVLCDQLNDDSTGDHLRNVSEISSRKWHGLPGRALPQDAWAGKVLDRAIVTGEQPERERWRIQSERRSKEDRGYYYENDAKYGNTGVFTTREEKADRGRRILWSLGDTSEHLPSTEFYHLRPVEKTRFSGGTLAAQSTTATPAATTRPTSRCSSRAAEALESNKASTSPTNSMSTTRTRTNLPACR